MNFTVFAKDQRIRGTDQLREVSRRVILARDHEVTVAIDLDRLEALGLKPGAVDGQFDDRTRRAIRRYQDARQLQVTGYLDQATVVRLLADSLLR